MYCQQFQGEVPPFENLHFTHGICQTCAGKNEDVLDKMVAHSLQLSGIQGQLREAGKAGNIVAAAQIVESALDAGVRPVDILIGLISPLLYEVGEKWSKRAITVADEHRFTAVCEELFQTIEARVIRETPAVSTLPIEVLLLNVPGNNHTFAIRILALEFVSRGRRAVALYPSPGSEALAKLLLQMQPRLLLISMALPEQRSSAVTIVEFVTALSDIAAPKIIVGGYPVKLGMVAPIPGAELLADIHSL
jgi:methanogenic corrinoid protein MtbC1